MCENKKGSESQTPKPFIFLSLPWDSNPRPAHYE